MPIKLYADHQVDFAVVESLRNRNVDILISLEDKTDKFDDPDLLDRSSNLKRVLFTQDKDLSCRNHKAPKIRGIFFRGNIR